ncbi:MAG: GGDEF domain-containing protein [Proteobacteria bacterium]|nr:GGDEF domain-containing protein [Pseudomonadota bacterium]
MNQAPLLLAVILFQQSLFGGLWLMAASLQLARRAALHWSAATLMVAAGMALVLVRASIDPWLGVVLANALLVLSFVAMRRGIQIFGRLPPSDREHAAVAALVVAGNAASTLLGGNMLLTVGLSSTLIGWTLLRAAHEVMLSLSDEFGRSAARWCAAPAALIGALFALRPVVGLFIGMASVGAIDAPGNGNLATAFASMVFGMLINTALLAMVVLRLVRRLQHQSDHDALTGLLGRRPMQRLLNAEARRQRRFGSGYAMLSLDIDHFKAINDSHGHAAGDAVLVRVAQALRSHVREVDRVARMGGEEFCVLLPGTDEAGARRSAERLLAAVRALRHPEGGGLQVTISIGLAVVKGGGEPLASLTRRLDRALYAAKARGRDRIEQAEPSVLA